ncbi:sensor domain-containing diguanylate cyclase [Sphaerotilaceae bacterium SBD11-9]
MSLLLQTPRRCLASVMLVLQLAWMVACGPALAAEAGEVVLSKGIASPVLVDHGVELLIEEPGELLTPLRVMSPEMAGRWALYPGKRINLSRQVKPVWIRFNVRHQAEAGTNWLLAIDMPVLKNIDFHQVDPAAQRVLSSHSAGLSRPTRGELLKDPTPPFPIEFGAGERASVLLRVQTDNQFVVPLSLWEEKEFHAKRYDHAVAMGLLFGVLGVMFFYNLSLFVFTRERSFLSYSVYLLSIVLYELVITGYGPFYVWGGSEWLKARGYELFACFSFLAASFFFRHFLGLKQAATHLNRINQATIAFWAVCALAAFFPASRALGLAIALGGMACGPLGVYTALYLSIKGNVLARYFAIAWIAIIVATAVALLSMFGVLEPGWWVSNAQHLGFVVETVLLSIALAEQIKREKASKEAAQRESLQLARKVEQEREQKILAQEHALAVQLQANEELELRVLDRTAELKRAMENVELANVQLAKLSVTDALTKVHNRRYFDETLKKELDRSARTRTPLALLLADIDYFKRINDSVGHLAGDECLKLVAAALASTIGRSTDLVARYGGEEFAIVLPATDATHALEAAERVRKAVEDIQFIYRGKRIPISISLGVVARVAVAHQPASDFVSEADQALYAAKGAGRNRAMLAAA